MKHPQEQKFRFQTMDAFFSLLASLQNPVLDLGIRNLQVDNPRDPETLANMEKALQGLRSLRLSIVSEHNEAAPENDLKVLPYPSHLFTFFLTKSVLRNSPILLRAPKHMAKPHYALAPAPVALRARVLRFLPETRPLYAALPAS